MRGRLLCPGWLESLDDMKFLHIPELNRDVSRLGIGSLKFNTESQAETASLLDAYQAAGGNLVDTAEIYGLGKSEQAIGQYLKLRATRSQWVVLTKACVEPALVRPEYIRAAVDKSLERLQTDYIDLFVLHRDDPQVPVGEIIDVLDELVVSGKARAYGGSNWSVARLADATRYAEQNSLHRPSISSPHLGLATPNEPTWSGCTNATAADLEWYAKHRMPVFGWSAQCRGFFAAESSPSSLSNSELVRVYHSAENFEKLERARMLARERQVEPVQIALAWVLNQQAPTIALVGPNSVAELEVALGGVEIGLTPSEMSWLEGSLAAG